MWENALFQLQLSSFDGIPAGEAVGLSLIFLKHHNTVIYSEYFAIHSRF